MLFADELIGTQTVGALGTAAPDSRLRRLRAAEKELARCRSGNAATVSGRRLPRR
jgi:hypothetical protein